jgi:RsiW-degrading membrane proteinase PrsW (M82 family)
MPAYAQIAINLLVALSPVLVFLFVLEHLDSFKLVKRTRVLTMVVAGAALAGVAWLVNGFVIARLHMELADYSRFVAPVVEEVLKASALAYLFLRNRIGFRVDAAILGFAIGTGFSIAENSYLLHVLSHANIAVWIIRGFGTAMMHGGATAIVAILTQTLLERRASPWLFLPGLLAAIALHALFNYFPDQMVLATLGTFIVLPIILLLIVAKGEHAVHTWLQSDYQSHEQLLADIESGAFAHQAAGRFVASLAKSAADVEVIFAYIKLHTLLVLRAEQNELAQESGGDVSLGDVDAAAFAKLHTLERQIGRAVLLALRPFLKFSRKELFELYQLEVAARAKAVKAAAKAAKAAANKAKKA